MRRLGVVLSIVMVAVLPAGASADPPLPEPGFATGGTPGTCVRVDFDDPTITEDPYGEKCSRLKFAYGPIVVQPGNNSVGLTFQTIEKPAYDGYITRIAPDLVDVQGESPDVTDVHLHHATWLSYPEYGNGPFFAAGEEKTVAEYPVGYGMPVRRSDVWYMVHMVHNAGTAPMTLWITYDIDYVAKADAESLTLPDGSTGLKTILPFWLDVWKNGRRASYPVYNTMRGYGEPITDPVSLDIVRDPDTGLPNTTMECTWPRDECASEDSWSETDVGQGAPGNGKGTDVYVPERLAGTLIGIGGHLHPGGLRVEVDNVRCTEGEAIRPNGTISSWGGLACPDADSDGVAGEETARVFTSDANYFDNEPLSWNFRMTVTGVPNWKVKIDAGTFLRINSVYETELASWYEGMGIAVAYVHPGGEYGLDPFAADIRNDVPAAECWATMTENTLCTRGTITRKSSPTAQTRGGANAGPWEVLPGPEVQDVSIASFLYEPGDLATASILGVPRVKRDQPLTFWNQDAAQNVYHSVTACAYPCNGATGIDYPIADFGWGRLDLAPGGAGPRVFDSSELGYSTFFGPAKGQIPIPGGQAPQDWAVNAVKFTMVPADYGLQAGETYTYFCRIHPFMRGAFTVVE